MKKDTVNVVAMRLLAIDRAMGFHARNELTCCGVTLAQCHAVMELGLSGGASGKELADALGLDKSTLSRTIDGLVAAGLAERRAVENNRRTVMVRLTDKGITTFDRINEAWLYFCRGLVKNIPIKKQKMVVEALGCIEDAMSKKDVASRFVQKCCPDGRCT